MQGLSGLNVEALLQSLLTALAESDNLLEAAGEVLEVLEDQDLGEEDPGDAMQPEHPTPGQGRKTPRYLHSCLQIRTPGRLAPALVI